MEYIKPIDPADYIEASATLSGKLLDKYFSEITLEDAMREEKLDQKYTISLLLNIQTEYYAHLKNLWETIPRANRRREFSEVFQYPVIEEAGDPMVLEKAYKDATRRTLWERLTKTNYKDVLEYKILLKQYAEATLNSMHSRFCAAVSALR